MSFFLYPRYFDDVEVPYRDDNYKFYIDWLANHLFNNEINNTVIDDSRLNERISDALMLGENAWYHELYCYEPFIQYIEQGKDYQYVLQEMKKHHDEIYEDETDEDGKDDINDWINPKVWENAKREYHEKCKVTPEHIDVGYRKELRVLLAGIGLHDNRCQILDAFFRSYTNESYK